MDFIREAENYLRYYAGLKKSIDHANHMIGKIYKRSRPSDKVTATLDPVGIHADYPVNTLNDLYELQKWQQVKNDNLAEIEHIDAILNNINQEEGCEKYKDVLLMWYVDKKDKYEIAEALGYSRRNMFYIRDRAVKKFAIHLFGLLAIKAM